MEALYTKLSNKYSKLKQKRESELETFSRDQDVRHLSFMEESQELVENLKRENDKLRAEVSDLKSEVAILRTAMAEQKAECERVLLEKFASGENSKVRTRKRRREFRQEQELMLTQNATEEGEPANDSSKETISRGTDHGNTANESTKETMSGGNYLYENQPECCKRKLGNSVDIAVPTGCVFQELVERLVDMKLSVGIETSDETFVSAVHESSGYSFSLTWIKNKAGEDEFLYRLSSLGTFERVAPEWMRDTIWFSRNMCRFFFQRVAKMCNTG